ADRIEVYGLAVRRPLDSVLDLFGYDWIEGKEEALPEPAAKEIAPFRTRYLQCRLIHLDNGPVKVECPSERSDVVDDGTRQHGRRAHSMTSFYLHYQTQRG